MKPVPPEPGQTMQRVKVGMTGLAIVLLLIALASALFNSAARDRTVAAKPDPLGNAVLANAGDAAEPLAELGIAPSANGNSATPAATPR